MAKLKLGINCGFAVNRFPEPEVWLEIVGRELGLRYAQFVADLLNPFLPFHVLMDEIQRIKENAKKYDVSIDTTFTSAFTRVNHLMHPNPLMREAWFQWFKDLITLTALLGARGTGSHLGILSVRDYENPQRREALIEGAIDYWKRLSEFASGLGLKFLFFEPMSIPREMGGTIDETKWLLERLNEGSALPILLLLDVDHGYAGSGNPRDIDPYVWIRELGPYAPVIHIKQSTADKGAHWPFTEEYNKLGIITASKVLEAIEESGLEETLLVLEISHRERYPTEHRVLDDLKASVEYWRKYVKD